jgi:hypothetical protein
MNLDRNDESIDQRRARLAAEIARQRGELAGAYQNLSKPFHYAESAMRGFGFIRQNPWIISTVPAVLSIASTLMGLRKEKSAPKRKGSLRERRELEELERKPRTLAGHAAKWGGRGWKLFKIYRRLRHFIS